MLAFAGQIKILGKYEGESIKVNEYLFDTYEVEAGKEVIKAFFDVRFPVSVGDCIYSEDMYITDGMTRAKDSRTAEFLSVRVGSFRIIPEEEYEKKEHFVVKCNGKLLKPIDDKGVRKIGPANKPFYACTFSIKNEFGKPFTILLIGFYNKAKKLYDLPNGTYMNIEAKLFQKRVTGGHELMLLGFDKC